MESNNEVGLNSAATLVSYGESVQINKQGSLTEFNFGEIAERIRKDDKLKSLVQKLRAIDDKDERNNFKKNNFPYFSMGQFKNGQRTNANIISIKRIVIDVDSIPQDKLDSLRNELKNDVFVYCFFISPSGNGLKVICELDNSVTDNETYKKVYIACATLFSAKYGVETDQATKDISRACFLSYDPDIYINASSKHINVRDALSYYDSLFPAAPIRSGLNVNGDLDEAVDFLIEKNNSGADIYNNYHDWQILGLSLASVGEKGRKAFFKLSAANSKYDDSEQDLNKEYDKLVEYYGTSGRAVTIATLFYVAQQHGYQLQRRHYGRTDTGNARRLVDYFIDSIRYNHTFQTWLIWEGSRWREDKTDKIYDFSRAVVKRLFEELAGITDETQREKLAKWACASENKAKQENLLKLAATFQDIALTLDDLDKNHYLFNCANCSLDLSNGRVKSMNQYRDHYITKTSPVRYDPEAECPQWDKFINRIFDDDDELICFVQKAVGYCLTGNISEQILFFCYGRGGNGKSVFFKCLENLFGDYFQKAPAEMLLAQKITSQVPNDIARLPGARFVIASELEEGRTLAESRVKDLTGGDTIVARKLHQEFFEFQPTHKIWLYGNHRPGVRGTDNGIWRRLKLIPFTVEIPESERIPMEKMVEMLCNELSGILNWVLEGYEMYASEGLKDAESVVQATHSYRNAMDVIENFLEDFTEDDPDSTVSTGELFQEYKHWAEQASERLMSLREFTEKLKQKGLQYFQGSGRKGFIRGLRLLGSE